ncbi:MAG: hypothetical protein WCW67_04670 [Candidatus Margulisiibacteriota bacterium]|jgi:hypothetical protein
MTITDKDVEKLKEVFATKEDLARLEAKQDGFQSEVITALDKVMDELVKAREDRTLAIGKDREQDRRLDRLEAKVG